MGTIQSSEEKELAEKYNLGPREIRAWSTTYNRYCSNTRVGMTLDDFVKAHSVLSLASSSELRNAFREMDFDDDGVINFSEFMFGILVNRRVGEIIRLRYAFDRMDTNGDGSISRDELFKLMTEAANYLGQSISRAQMERYFRRLDTDCSDSIDIGEFVQYVETKEGRWLLDYLHLV